LACRSMSSSFAKPGGEESTARHRLEKTLHGYLRSPSATSNVHLPRLVSGLRSGPFADRVGAFPGSPPVAFCHNAFSTTVAGAAPDFDRLPDFPPSLAGQHLELDLHLITRRRRALHCETTRPKSFATWSEVGVETKIRGIFHCFPRPAATDYISPLKAWRKRATEIDLQYLRCGKPREISTR